MNLELSDLLLCTAYVLSANCMRQPTFRELSAICVAQYPLGLPSRKGQLYGYDQTSDVICGRVRRDAF